MYSTLAWPCDCITAQVSGIDSGNKMPIAPQLEPVANAVAAASMKIITGRVNDGSESPKTLTRKSHIQPQIADIRRRGYAATVDELEDGFTAVATVIRGALGDVQGALSIGGPTQRLSPARRAELGASLCKAAARLNPGI